MGTTTKNNEGTTRQEIERLMKEIQQKEKELEELKKKARRLIYNC